MKAPWYAAFTPYYRHHIEEEQGRDLPLFMDTCLRGGSAWPKTPELKIIARQHRACPRQAPARCIASRSRTLKSTMRSTTKPDYPLLATDRVKPQWPGAGPHGCRSSYPRDRLFGFANVTYESGICLTSNFQAVVPAELGRPRPPIGRRW